MSTGLLLLPCILTYDDSLPNGPLVQLVVSSRRATTPSAPLTMSAGLTPTFNSSPAPADIETPQPIHDVMQTPELLEMILMDLDMKTLLLSQRVCKTLANTVSGS
jgi:hypothetical protein